MTCNTGSLAALCCRVPRGVYTWPSASTGNFQCDAEYSIRNGRRGQHPGTYSIEMVEGRSSALCSASQLSHVMAVHESVLTTSGTSSRKSPSLQRCHVLKFLDSWLLGQLVVPPDIISCLETSRVQVWCIQTFLVPHSVQACVFLIQIVIKFVGAIPGVPRSLSYILPKLLLTTTAPLAAATFAHIPLFIQLCLEW